MNRTIEDLWRGSIQPQEQLLKNDPELKQLIEYMSRHKKNLLETMDEQQKETFEKYMDCQVEYSMLFEMANFELGFQLGARFMLAVLADQEDTP